MARQFKMDGDLDDISVIDALTINNLETISFMDMLRILEPLILVAIPEGNMSDKNAERQRLDYLLARLANLNAYLKHLWAAASYKRARLKHSDEAKSEDMLKKKEALYELSGAVKLKYEAVSRRITVALDEDRMEPERADHAGRSTRQATPKPQSSGGWRNVG